MVGQCRTCTRDVHCGAGCAAAHFWLRGPRQRRRYYGKPRRMPFGHLATPGRWTPFTGWSCGRGIYDPTPTLRYRGAGLRLGLARPGLYENDLSSHACSLTSPTTVDSRNLP